MALTRLDFELGQIVVHKGKGAKDRCTLFPLQLWDSLQTQLTKVRALHTQDLAQGYGEVALTDALDRKYPQVGRE